MAISGSTILIAGLVAAAVAAASAGAQMYMQSEAQAAQASQQRRMAEWQQQAEADQAEAARKQVRLRAQRYLNAQGAKAGGAGVVAGEGSLLVNQLEAASMSQYEEDLAAMGHEINSKTHGFEAKLFRQSQNRIESNEWIGVGLAAGSSAASSLASYSRKDTSTPNSGKTVATQTPNYDYVGPN